MSEIIDTAINGLGRIGVLTGRLTIDDPEMSLLAINGGGDLDVHDAVVRLEFDSVHGVFGEHAVSNTWNNIWVDQSRVALYGFRRLTEAPWRETSDSLVVIESTGSFVTKEDVQGHLDAGAKRVVITAPARDEVTPTIVRGVNDTEEAIAAIEDVVAVSSCSTNCIAPIMKVLDDNFKLRWGVTDTPHAYTNSQRALDGRGKDTAGRRGLDAMIPASTGSAKEVKRLFPHLDFFRAESMRVPIPDGSVAMLTVGIEGNLRPSDISEVITKATKTTHKGILNISPRRMYSARIIGQPFSAVIDPERITVDKTGDMSIVKLQAWFDNEWGYANRVVEVAKLVGRLI